MAQDPWLQPEGPQVQFTTASDRLGRTPPRSGARGHLSTSRLRAHWVPLQLRSATACFPGKASQSLVPPFSPPCTPLGRWGQAGGRMKPQPTPRLDSLRASLIPEEKTLLVLPPPLAPCGRSQEGRGGDSPVPGPPFPPPSGGGLHSPADTGRIFQVRLGPF